MALFGILLGQTLLLMDLIRDEFATRGGMPANVNSFILFFGSMVALPTFLKDNPLTFFFLAIGVYYGFTIPGKGKQTAKPTIEPMKSGAPSTSQAAPANAMSSRATPDSPFDAPPKV